MVTWKMCCWCSSALIWNGSLLRTCPSFFYFSFFAIFYCKVCSNCLVFLSCWSNFKNILKVRHSFVQMWKWKGFLHRFQSGIYDLSSTDTFSFCGSGDQTRAQIMPGNLSTDILHPKATLKCSTGECYFFFINCDLVHIC